MAGYLYAVSTYPIVGSKNMDGQSEKFSVRSASKRQAAMGRSDVPTIGGHLERSTVLRMEVLHGTPTSQA